MKKLSLIIFLFFLNIAFSQENIDLNSIIENRGYIFSELPLNYSMDGNIYETLRNGIPFEENNLTTIENDSVLKNDFPEEINFNNLHVWSKEELQSKYLVNNSISFLNFKKVNKTLHLTNPEEIRVLKKEIKTFNNRFDDWSKFPIHITRPYFSYSKTYAIIVIQFGNDGRQSILLKKINGVFQFYTYIENVVS